MTAKPASVEAKERMVEAVAGSRGGGFDRCFPPTPSAITKVITTGIQAIRSYLLLVQSTSPQKEEESRTSSKP